MPVVGVGLAVAGVELVAIGAPLPPVALAPALAGVVLAAGAPPETAVAGLGVVMVAPLGVASLPEQATSTQMLVHNPMMRCLTAVSSACLSESGIRLARVRESATSAYADRL
jgi:hypothetical protein